MRFGLHFSESVNIKLSRVDGRSFSVTTTSNFIVSPSLQFLSITHPWVAFLAEEAPTIVFLHWRELAGDALKMCLLDCSTNAIRSKCSLLSVMDGLARDGIT